MNKNFKNELAKVINGFKTGQYDYTINKVSTLLKKNQDNDFLWNIKGLILQAQKKYFLSLECLIKATNINPKNIAAINNLGISYKNIMNYPLAEKCFNKALIINPSYVNGLINLGNLKNETLHFNEAIIIYKKAISVDNKITECHINLAYAYQSINEIELAKVHLYETIKLDKTQTRADKMISMLLNYNENNDHLTEMIEKLQNLKLTEEKKIYLYFAISKAFEDQKNYDLSFDYLEKGNFLQRNQIEYNSKNITELSESIKSFFLNYNFKQNIKKINKKEVIFIMGLPRSGTTLVEKIISSHPKVSSLGELNHLSNLLMNRVIKNNKINIDIAEFFLNEDLAKDYFMYLENFNIKNEHITDKSLMNFWFIGFIKIFFPNSKIIHCHRNAKDNCLSIFKNLFDTHQGWFYDQDDLAKYYKTYKDLMSFWNNKLDGEILNIEYESLVKKTDREIKRIINFCNLDWDEACLNFHQSDTPIKTLSVNQANKPIYNSSLDTSKNYEKKLQKLFSKLN